MPSWTRKLHLQRNDRDTSRLWIPKSVLEHRRPSWRPVTRALDEAAAMPTGSVDPGPAPLSRFGGRPLLGDAVQRPACGNCGGPMTLFLQLCSAELPLGASRSFGDGVLQLFYCTNEEPLCEMEAEAFVPFGKSTLVRVLPREEVEELREKLPAESPSVVSVVSAAEPTLPCRLITGWVEGEDYPSLAELRRVGLKRSDAVVNALDKLFPASVDKLGGWPFWKGHVDYPQCPECGRDLDLVFQLETHKNLPYWFGPAPCAYVFGCSEHRDRLGFGWSYGH